MSPHANNESSEIKLVVLDLAGTTVRDDGRVPQAFRAAFAQQRIEVTAEQLQMVRGASKRQAIARLLSDGPERAAREEWIYATFRKLLAEGYERKGVEPVAGATDVMLWLRARGVRVALNTGFDRDTTGLLLRALQWDKGVADAVVTGDDVVHGRPAPDLILHAMRATGITDVHAVANAGDTVLDLQAGHAAGVRWNIGVLSGAHAREMLEQAPHTHILPSVADLPSLWTLA